MKLNEKLRLDFPFLNSHNREKNVVYLDNAATTQKPRCVIDTIGDYYATFNANVHRAAHEMAEKATAELEKTRELCAKFLNAKSTDEIKFTKFVGRMRKRFASMFNDMLKTQLILKNIVTPEDWEVLSDHIQYDFVYDNHFAELKETELINERMGVVAALDPYVGKYFSLDYVRRKILKQKDEEIIEIDKQMALEIKQGKMADPMEVQQLQMGVHPEQMPGGALNPQPDPGAMGAPTEPGIDGSATEAPEMPEGGEI